MVSIWSNVLLDSGISTKNVERGTKSVQCSAEGLLQDEKMIAVSSKGIKVKENNFFKNGTADNIISLLGIGYYHSLNMLW